jgi:hypothetical protein
MRFLLVWNILERSLPWKPLITQRGPMLGIVLQYLEKIVLVSRCPFDTYCLWVFGAKSGPPATNKTSILLINPLETSLDIGASTSKLMLVERKSW